MDLKQWIKDIIHQWLAWLDDKIKNEVHIKIPILSWIIGEVDDYVWGLLRRGILSDASIDSFIDGFLRDPANVRQAVRYGIAIVAAHRQMAQEIAAEPSNLPTAVSV